MNERLTDNEFHSKDNKERACYIQEPRLQAIYDKCFEYEDIDTNPTRLANIKKAFEIIKDKIKIEFNDHYFGIKGNYYIIVNNDVFGAIKVSKEQFDLLKEVLYGLPTKQV